MKSLLLLIVFLAVPVFGQSVYPPEGVTVGLDSTALGSYNLCVETGQTLTTTGTVEETLATCTIPADSLGGTNDFSGFEITAEYTGAANVNSKSAIVDLDITEIHNQASTVSGEQWSISSRCAVKDATTVQCLNSTIIASAAPDVQIQDVTLTFTAAIDIDFNGLTGTQAGDITLTSYRVILTSAYGGSIGSFWPLLAPDWVGGANTAYSFANDANAGLFRFNATDALYLASGIGGEARGQLELYKSGVEGYFILAGRDTSDTITGIDGNSNSDFVNIKTNGITRMTANTGDITTTVPILMPDGDADNPSLALVANPTAGIWATAAGSVVLQGATASGLDQASTATGNLRGGAGTGTGVGGNINIQVAPPSATSGSTLNAFKGGLFIHGGTGYVNLGGIDSPSVSTSNWSGNDMEAGQTDSNGGSVIVRAGLGTGSGSSGSFRIDTGLPGASSSTQHTTQTLFLLNGGTGQTIIGALDVTNTAPGNIDIRGNHAAAGLTDSAGGDLELRGGLGTGAGTPGVINFTTGTTAGSSSIQQSYTTTPLTVAETALTTTVPILAPDGLITAPSYSFADVPSSGLYATATDDGGNVILKGGDITGTDVRGGRVVLNLGKGTGTGRGGHFGINASIPTDGVSGSTPNDYQTALYVDGLNGYTLIGGLDAFNPGTSQLQGASRASGLTDGAGGVINIIGGFGTGAGAPGTVVVRTGTTLGTGSTQQTATTRLTIDEDEVVAAVPIRLPSILFTSLGTPANGSIAYCSDCTKATPCAGSGTGAMAKRINGAWDCD